MERPNLRGMGIAVVSPMTDSGEVDYLSFERLLTYQVSEGADFIVLLGTTGESPAIEAGERERLVAIAAEVIAGRLPLVLGVGDNCTHRLVERLETLDTRGIDAILSVAPYYNKPGQEGIYRHFRAAAAASELPIVVYNIQGRTGVNITAETMLRLANDCPEIIGVKEASENVEQVRMLCRNRPEGFFVLSGDDHMSVPFIREGADGVISVVGNAYPRLLKRMIHAALSAEATEEIFPRDLMDKLCRSLFCEGNPSGIKALLKIKRLIASDSLRLPLLPLSRAAGEILAAIDKDLVSVS